MAIRMFDIIHKKKHSAKEFESSLGPLEPLVLAQFVCFKLLSIGEKYHYTDCSTAQQY